MGKKYIEKPKQRLSDLWDNIKWCKIYTIGVLEKSERMKQKNI